MSGLWTAAGAGLFAGGVAVGVTLAIERWGGVRGGLLGTVPTTIVPASLGFQAQATTPEALRQALWAVPVGMLANALFLFAWRAIPPRLPPWSLGRRLVAVLGLSLLGWGLAAGAMVLGLRALRADGVSLLWPGLLAAALLLLGGAWASTAPVKAPRGRRPVGPLTLCLRGSLAAGAIAAAVLVQGAGGEVLAGMLAVFPAIFLTAMVGLWLSQGEAVPAGAVGPMLLGSSSVAAYAHLAAWSQPALGPVAGAALAWAGAVGGVTLPAGLWLQRRAAAAGGSGQGS